MTGTLFGVSTDYERNEGHRRDYLTVWSGPFMSVFEATGVSLPGRNGYMLTTYNGNRVRVECPVPRTEKTYLEVDRAISEALAKHYEPVAAEQ